MAKLTPQQEALLAFAEEADDRYRSAKLNARKRAAEMIEREIAAFSAARDKAVWEAVEAGVPKRQIGLVALKTTSPNTVQEIYRRVMDSQEFVEVELAKKAVPKYQWSERHPSPNGLMHYWYLLVDGDDFRTTIENFEGDGYLYMRHSDGSYMWGPAKPDEAAQQWVKENPPA